MQVNDEPRLVFVAKREIEVGEELLFNYNDHQSREPFLRSCPICNGNGKRKPQPGPALELAVRESVSTHQVYQQKCGVRTTG